MISVLIFIGTLLSFMNIKIATYFSIFSFLIAAIILGLGFFGFIDKNGKLEQGANEFISSYTGYPLEELEKLEGVKNGL